MLYVFFVSPYFDHDAFMHHTMHALDSPGTNKAIDSETLTVLQPFSTLS